jgi:hypothetical protein
MSDQWGTPSDDATQVMWETRGKDTARWQEAQRHDVRTRSEETREEYRLRLDAAKLAAETITAHLANQATRYPDLERGMAKHVRFWENYLRTGTVE